MKFRLLWATLFSILSTVGTYGSDAQADTRSEIETFEEGFSSALAHNDVAAVKGYLSDDWTIVSGDGAIITRERFLDVLASGDLKHDDMASEGQTIRIYGNTALVTARTQSRGSYKREKFDTDELGTDVLVKTGERWICVFTQLTTNRQR